MQELLTGAGQVGVFAVMVLFFVWWGKQREERLGARLNETEDFVRSTLMSEQRETRAVIERNTAAHQTSAAAQAEVARVIQGCAAWQNGHAQRDMCEGAST